MLIGIGFGFLGIAERLKVPGSTAVAIAAAVESAVLAAQNSDRVEETVRGLA